ncbi:MAG: hypothetical protein ACQEXN_14510 [Actinomycetota bacterium]
MRTLAKLTTGAVVLLTLASCSSDPKSGIAALEAPAGSADTFAGDIETLGIAPDSTRLLVEENDYAFYIAAPDKPEKGNVCLVIQTPEPETGASGCGNFPNLHPLELGTAGVSAKLIADNYDASKELSEGWRQLHKNLLVRGGM